MNLFGTNLPTSYDATCLCFKRSATTCCDQQDSTRLNLPSRGAGGVRSRLSLVVEGSHPIDPAGYLSPLFPGTRSSAPVPPVPAPPEANVTTEHRDEVIGCRAARAGHASTRVPLANGRQVVKLFAEKRIRLGLKKGACSPTDLTLA